MKGISNQILCLKQLRNVSFLLAFGILITSCYKEEIVPEEKSVIPGTGLADWTAETHGDELIPTTISFSRKIR